MFTIGQRIRKVRGDVNLGAEGFVVGIDVGGTDGCRTRIRADYPMQTTTSGRMSVAHRGETLWIRDEEWALIEYDGAEPAHWADCCWTPRRGFVKK